MEVKMTELFSAVKQAMMKGDMTKIFALMRRYIIPLYELLQNSRKPAAEGGEMQEGEDQYMIIAEPMPDGELKFRFMTLAREAENTYKVKRFGNLGSLEEIIKEGITKKAKNGQ